jgi:seryl-tRNA synthetase
LLDMALLRSDPDLIRRTILQRGAEVDLDRITEADTALREATTRLSTLRARHRRQAMSREPVDADTVRARQDELRAVTEQMRAAQELRDELWAQVPNLVGPDTPPGVDEGGNVELRRMGTPVAAEEARHHDTVCTGLDLARRAEAAGTGYRYWSGDGARLSWAVFTHVQRVLQSRGFTPLLIPAPATAQTVLGYYGDQIVDADHLPIRICAFAPGRQADPTGGEHHTHQVEQIVLCRPQDAEHWLAECQRNTEDLLHELELPYRVVRVCLGVLAPAAYQQYGTQCWFPGSGGYRQTHSTSQLTDYQARRLRIRYLERGRVAQPHTVVATGVTDRAVLAILENQLQPDGSVRIPQVLRPYLGGQELIAPRPVVG